MSIALSLPISNRHEIITLVIIAKKFKKADQEKALFQEWDRTEDYTSDLCPLSH